jgi:hypothetical protein
VGLKFGLTLREEHRLRVYKNRVLRIFGPKREEVAGGWRKLHNNGLHNLYTSPNIIRVIESRRMRWVWNVACMREMRNGYKIFLRKTEDLGVDRKVILEWILGK